MNDFQTVCKVQELREAEGKTVVLGKKLVAVFLVKGTVFAIDDTCPHMGMSLAGGHVEDGIVTCPWHAWRFRLADGVWADNPRIRTGCYEVRLVGDDVQIQVQGTPPGKVT